MITRSSAFTHRPLATVSLLLQLMRFERPLCSALLALLGAHLGASPSRLASAPVWAAACVVALVTGFGFVINDCCDVTVDALGKPDRPLPSGRISPGAAAAFAWVLACCAVLLAAMLGRDATLFAAGAVALSAAYSYRLKSTLLLGNAAVGLLVAAVIVFAAVVAGGGVTGAVIAAAAMAWSYITAQEVLFNLEDEAEDRTAGLRTTATQLGVARTAVLLRVLLVTFVVVALLPCVRPTTSPFYAGALAVCTLLPVAALLWLLRSPLSRAAIARAARWSRLVWLTSFVPLALLK
jgi:geranylgeranylglycerol-phosphate geranylgeranyltransferase